jgi:hypothetical protein
MTEEKEKAGASRALLYKAGEKGVECRQGQSRQQNISPEDIGAE